MPNSAGRHLPTPVSVDAEPLPVGQSACSWWKQPLLQRRAASGGSFVPSPSVLRQRPGPCLETFLEDILKVADCVQWTTFFFVFMIEIFSENRKSFLVGLRCQLPSSADTLIHVCKVRLYIYSVYKEFFHTPLTSCTLCRLVVSESRLDLASKTIAFPLPEWKLSASIVEACRRKWFTRSRMQSEARPDTRKTSSKVEGIQWLVWNGHWLLSAIFSLTVEYLELILEKLLLMLWLPYEASTCICEYMYALEGMSVDKHPTLVEFLKHVKEHSICVILSSWDLSTVVIMLCAPPLFCWR